MSNSPMAVHWLANEFRNSRLSVLQGGTETGKTALLKRVLLPSLQRRRSDRAAAPTAPALAITPDRRQKFRSNTDRMDREIAVYVDGARWDPLAALWRALQEAMNLSGASRSIPAHGELTRTLIDWAAGRSLRFLIVVDNFDVCAAASFNDPLAKDLVEEVLSSLSNPASPAHFLVSFTEDAQPLWSLLGRYGLVTDGLDLHRLTLPSDLSVGRENAPKPPPPEAAPVAAPDHEPDLEPDVERYVEPVEDPPARPTPEPTTEPVAARRPVAPVAQVAPVAPTTVVVARSKNQARLIVVAAFGLGCMVWLGIIFAPSLNAVNPLRPERQAARAERLPTSTSTPTPTPTSTPEASPKPSPSYGMVVDTSGGQSALMSSEIARLTTPAGFDAPAIRPVSGWSAQLSALQRQPGVAVLTYDVLQAARNEQGVSLQVLTPLFSEEIYFVVRDDSPLHYIHEIKNASLNVGPPGGQRALTADTIYRRMFGSGLPPSAGGSANAGIEQALDQLLTRQSDSNSVLVMVGAQPDARLSNLSSEQKQRLRVLELDPANPITRKAAAMYLTSRVKPESGSGLEKPEGTKTFAVMSFLVTGADTTMTSDAGTMATAVCRNLPALIANGHPKWREVEAGLQLETTWATAPAADTVFSKRCG